MTNQFEQWINASVLFQGGHIKSEAVMQIYDESAEMIAHVLNGCLSEDDGSMKSIVDFGCFKGELLWNVLELLPDRDWYTVGVEANESSLRANGIVQGKILADLDDIPLENKSIDFGIMRYILPWNIPEKTASYSSGNLQNCTRSAYYSACRGQIIKTLKNGR